MDDLDIVTRLRVLNHHAKKLAENESLHELYREAFTRCEDLTWEAANEIERLRKERDEARREMCMILAGKGGKSSYTSPDAIRIAEERGWDCFKSVDKTL